METKLAIQIACTVRIISAKKPAYSLLCSEDIDNLSIGEQLRFMRLRAGLTLEQAAQAVGVERRCIMNYELDRVKHMKRDILTKLFMLYEKQKIKPAIFCTDFNNIFIIAEFNFGLSTLLKRPSRYGRRRFGQANSA